jgi:hypothetical protein
MGLHAVIAKGDGNVMVRSTSCYCQGCVSSNVMCDGWILHDLTSTNDKPNQYEGDRDNNAVTSKTVKTFVLILATMFVQCIRSNGISVRSSALIL